MDHHSNILLKTIGTFWNYENVFRQQDRYELLKRILNNRYPMLKKRFEKICQRRIKRSVSEYESVDRWNC